MGLLLIVSYHIHQVDAIVALFFDLFFYGTARFPNVKHKAQVTPFLYIGSLPQPHPKVDFGKRTVAKINKNMCKFFIFLKLFSTKYKNYRLSKKKCPIF